MEREKGFLEKTGKSLQYAAIVGGLVGLLARSTDLFVLSVLGFGGGTALEKMFKKAQR